MAESANYTLPPLQCSGYEALQISVQANCAISDSLLLLKWEEATLLTSVDCSVTAVFDLRELLVFPTITDVTTGLLAQTTITVVLSTAVSVGYVLPFKIVLDDAWVMEPSTGVSTRFADFGFNSYGYLDGVYLAAKDDGIYALNLNTTSFVEPLVPFAIDLGEIDLTALNLKRLPNVYAAIATDGNVYVKVASDGSEYIYKMRSADPTIKTRRFDLGRGFRNSNFALSIEGEGNTTISDLEFVPVVSTRRI